MILLPNMTLEQKVETVANNDVAINAAITAQAADDWQVQFIFLSGTDVILLFHRTIENPDT